jgi:hypothetical protein
VVYMLHARFWTREGGWKLKASFFPLLLTVLTTTTHITLCRNVLYHHNTHCLCLAIRNAFFYYTDQTILLCLSTSVLNSESAGMGEASFSVHKLR